MEDGDRNRDRRSYGYGQQSQRRYDREEDYDDEDYDEEDYDEEDYDEENDNRVSRSSAAALAPSSTSSWKPWWQCFRSSRAAR